MSEKNKTIAEKTAALNELVAWFEGDDFVLEEALAKYAKAEKLAAEIEGDLKALKNNIETVKAKFNEA